MSHQRAIRRRKKRAYAGGDPYARPLRFGGDYNDSVQRRRARPHYREGAAQRLEGSCCQLDCELKFDAYTNCIQLNNEYTRAESVEDLVHAISADTRNYRMATREHDTAEFYYYVEFTVSDFTLVNSPSFSNYRRKGFERVCRRYFLKAYQIDPKMWRAALEQLRAAANYDRLVRDYTRTVVDASTVDGEFFRYFDAQRRKCHTDLLCASRTLTTTPLATFCAALPFNYDCKNAVGGGFQRASLYACYLIKSARLLPKPQQQGTDELFAPHAPPLAALEMTDHTVPSVVGKYESGRGAFFTALANACPVYDARRECLVLPHARRAALQRMYPSWAADYWNEKCPRRGVYVAHVRHGSGCFACNTETTPAGALGNTNAHMFVHAAGSFICERMLEFDSFVRIDLVGAWLPLMRPTSLANVSAERMRKIEHELAYREGYLIRNELVYMCDIGVCSKLMSRRQFPAAARVPHFDESVAVYVEQRTGREPDAPEPARLVLIPVAVTDGGEYAQRATRLAVDSVYRYFYTLKSRVDTCVAGGRRSLLHLHGVMRCGYENVDTAYVRAVFAQCVRTLAAYAVRCDFEVLVDLRFVVVPLVHCASSFACACIDDVLPDALPDFRFDAELYTTADVGSEADAREALPVDAIDADALNAAAAAREAVCTEFFAFNRDMRDADALNSTFAESTLYVHDAQPLASRARRERDAFKKEARREQQRGGGGGASESNESSPVFMIDADLQWARRAWPLLAGVFSRSSRDTCAVYVRSLAVFGTSAPSQSEKHVLNELLAMSATDTCHHNSFLGRCFMRTTRLQANTAFVRCDAAPWLYARVPSLRARTYVGDKQRPLKKPPSARALKNRTARALTFLANQDECLDE